MHCMSARHAKRERGNAIRGFLRVPHVRGKRTPSFVVVGTVYPGSMLIKRSVKNRICQYEDFIETHSSEISRNGGQPDRLAPKNYFPGVFFLDHLVFQQSLVEIPNPSTFLSRQILEHFQDDSQMRKVASQYFENIQPFMPMISKKLFYERHLNPLAPTQTDVLLLCFCMKIFTWNPSEDDSDPQTPDYLSAKHFMVDVEVAGIFTLQVLQASLLIAIYEIGHGIYPAAQFSVGACAARGVALDLEKEWINGTTSRLSWVEQEERLRVWWAIVILERFGNIDKR